MYDIRAMAAEDCAEMIALWETDAGIGLTGEDDSREAISRFLARNPGGCFVALADGGIIGTIMAGNDGRRGHIYHLMVKAEYRRNGLGKALLAKAEAALKEAGIRKVFLLAFRDNKAGNAFWRKQGYGKRDDLNYRDKSLTD